MLGEKITTNKAGDWTDSSTLDTRVSFLYLLSGKQTNDADTENCDTFTVSGDGYEEFTEFEF